LAVITQEWPFLEYLTGTLIHKNVWEGLNALLKILGKRQKTLGGVIATMPSPTIFHFKQSFHFKFSILLFKRLL